METKTKKKTMSKEKLIALISQEKEIHPNDVRHVIQAFLDNPSLPFSLRRFADSSLHLDFR